ncbi:MAG: TIGR01777 family oxidoreductase [Bacteroidales bacterium]|nr:TIGR01777 family oxidoreductase [Bacteroidales bacterium]
MKIAISGSHGLLANYLIKSFHQHGHTVAPINRRLLSNENFDALQKIIQGCDVVINMAGEPINQRWNRAGKKRIHDSRILTTRAIVKAINCLEKKPKLFISASAIGAYPIDAICDETEIRYGDNFLAEVCRAWEFEAQKISSDVRLVIPRIGIVLAPDGGVFPQIIMPFKFFVGGKIASGEQGFSWIHIDDLVSIFEFMIDTPEAKGILNVTVPQNTDNHIFTQAISLELNRPSWLNIPRFLLKLVLGEREILITQGQKIYPGKLFQLGYQFIHPTIESAIWNLLYSKKD